MLSKFCKISWLITLCTLPVFSFSQSFTKTSTLLGSIKTIVTSTLVPLAFTLALLFFFWGIAKYIWSVGGDAKDEGKKIMTWGVVAMFVMASIWGIVTFLGGVFGLDSSKTNMDIPTIGGGGSRSGGCAGEPGTPDCP